MNTQDLDSEEVCQICENEIKSTIYSKCLFCLKSFHTGCNIYPEEIYNKYNLCDICRFCKNNLFKDEKEENEKKIMHYKCLLCEKSDGILFRYGKKINDWVHISCIRWFEFKIEKDEKDYFYISSNVKNFLDYLSSDCNICKRTKKGDFLINCRNKEKGSSCENIYYHRSCLMNNNNYRECVEKTSTNNNMVIKIYRCFEHNKNYQEKSLLINNITSGRDLHRENNFKESLKKMTDENDFNVSNHSSKFITYEVQKGIIGPSFYNSHSKDFSNQDEKEKSSINSNISNNNKRFYKEKLDCMLDLNENRLFDNNENINFYNKFQNKFINTPFIKSEKEMEGFQYNKNTSYNNDILKEESSLNNNSYKNIFKNINKSNFYDFNSNSRNTTFLDQEKIRNNIDFSKNINNFLNNNVYKKKIENSNNSIFVNDSNLIQFLTKDNQIKSKNNNKLEKNKVENIINKNLSLENNVNEKKSILSDDLYLNFNFVSLKNSEKCDICTKEIQTDISLKEDYSISKCKFCNNSVHKICADELDLLKDDTCSKCILEYKSNHDANKELKIKCFACERTEGSMISLNSKWIHYLCLFAIKKFYQDNNQIDYLKTIPINILEVLEIFNKNSKSNPCKLCNKLTYFTIKCNICNFYSHPYCAFLMNLETFHFKRPINRIENSLSEEKCKNIIFPYSSNVSVDNLKNFNVNQNSLILNKNVLNNYLLVNNFEIKCNMKHNKNFNNNFFYEKKIIDNRLKEKDLNRTNFNLKPTYNEKNYPSIIDNNNTKNGFNNSNTKSNYKSIDEDENLDKIKNENPNTNILNSNITQNLNNSKIKINKNKSKNSRKLNKKKSTVKALNKKNFEILENDKKFLNEKLYFGQKSEKENIMEHRNKYNDKPKNFRRSNRYEESGNSINDSLENFEDESEYFLNKNHSSSDKISDKTKIYKKKNKINFPIKSLKSQKSSSIDIFETIKSINLKPIKRLNCENQLEYFMNQEEKNRSVEEIEEEEKKYLSSWDFVSDYFRKFDLENLTVIFNKESKIEESNILKQYLKYWFFSNKIDPRKKKILELKEFEFINHEEFNENNIFWINSKNKILENKINKNEKFLKRKRNFRICKVNNKEKTLILIFEISNFQDILYRSSKDEKTHNSNFIHDLELNEINKLYSPNIFDENFHLINRHQNKDYYLSNRNKFTNTESLGFPNKFKSQDHEVNLIYKIPNVDVEKKSIKNDKYYSNNPNFNSIENKSFDLNSDLLKEVRTDNIKNDYLNTQIKLLLKRDIIENEEKLNSQKDQRDDIQISDCGMKIIINKSILEDLDLSQFNSLNIDNTSISKKKCLNSIKLKDFFEIPIQNNKLSELEKKSFNDIQSLFFKIENCYLNLREDELQIGNNYSFSESSFQNLDLHNMYDIDRMILLNNEMLNTLTNQNIGIFAKIESKIRNKINNTKYDKITKLLKQTESFSKDIYFENKPKNDIYNLDSSTKMIDIKKINEIKKIFYLPFSTEESIHHSKLINDPEDIADNSCDIKISFKKHQEMEINNSNGVHLYGDSKFKENEYNELKNIYKKYCIFNNPGIIEIKNYDIMEKEDFNLINNSFLVEYYSNNRFNHIKRRLKLGFKDKKFETIIKSRFTNERLNEIFGENIQKDLIQYNKEENQKNFNFEKIKEEIKKTDSDCCICMYSELDDTSVIVFCDCCNVGMHLECYGISNVDDIYLCDICVYILKNFSKNNFIVKNKENNISTNPNSIKKLPISSQKKKNSYLDSKDLDCENQENLRRASTIIHIDLDCMNNKYSCDKQKEEIVKYEETRKKIKKNRLKLSKTNQKIHNLNSNNSNNNFKILLNYEERENKNNDLEKNSKYYKEKHIKMDIEEERDIEFERDLPVENKLHISSQLSNIYEDGSIDFQKEKKLKNLNKKFNHTGYNNKLNKNNNNKDLISNINKNSILYQIKCIICGQCRGPMKNINLKECDWAHILCLIFSINYQIYDYGKILVKKLNYNENSIDNFIDNYSFYFKKENKYINNSNKNNQNFSQSKELDFYKNIQKGKYQQCEICNSLIGEVIPCLSCLEENRNENNKIPHFHVLCAYLNGNKMEVLENQEEISLENYYNFFLKRENLDKYMIQRSRVYAKIYCFNHSVSDQRNSEVQKIFRNIVYHKETILYKDFKHIYQFNKKDSKFNNFNSEKNFKHENYKSTKLNNHGYVGLKQSDNSTEDTNKNVMRQIILNRKSKSDRYETINGEIFNKNNSIRRNSLNLNNIQNNETNKCHLGINDGKSQENSQSYENQLIINFSNRLLETKGELPFFKDYQDELKKNLGKPNLISSEENLMIKKNFLDYYLSNQESINLYDQFCYNPEFSNYCKICFNGFEEGEETRVYCISCKICFHYKCFSDDDLRTKINIVCDFCLNKKNKKKEYYEKPTCMLCPNIGGAVRKITLNFSGKKTDYYNHDIFWAHNFCGKKLGLKSTKKKFEGLFLKIPYLNKFECEICNMKRGFVVKCAVKNCNRIFHLLCSKNSFIFCELHNALERKTKDQNKYEIFFQIFNKLEHQLNEVFSNNKIGEDKSNLYSLDQKDGLIIEIEIQNFPNNYPIMNNQDEFQLVPSIKEDKFNQISAIKEWLSEKLKNLKENKANYKEKINSEIKEDYPSPLFLYILDLPTEMSGNVLKNIGLIENTDKQEIIRMEIE